MQNKIETPSQGGYKFIKNHSRWIAIFLDEVTGIEELWARRSTPPACYCIKFRWWYYEFVSNYSRDYIEEACEYFDFEWMEYGEDGEELLSAEELEKKAKDFLQSKWVL